MPVLRAGPGIGCSATARVGREAGQASSCFSRWPPAQGGVKLPRSMASTTHSLAQRLKRQRANGRVTLTHGGATASLGQDAARRR
jgi:hypothetical protein